MNTKLVTGIVLVVSLVGLVAYDLVVNFNKVQGDTISEVLGATFKAAPVLAMGLGVVVGHLVGTMPAAKPVFAWLSEHLVIALLYGVLGGILFWNMARD